MFTSFENTVNVGREDLRQCLKSLGVSDQIADGFIKITYSLRKNLARSKVCKTDPNLSKLLYLWQEIFSTYIQNNDSEDLSIRSDEDLLNKLSVQIDLLKHSLAKKECADVSK